MKRAIIFTFLVISLLVLFGCAEKEEGSVCNKPYLEFMKGQCCLDSNDNKICDKDETKEEKTEEEKPVSLETPENVARKFASNWELEEYGEMYNFFTSELKQKKTITEFTYVMEESKIEDETYSVRLDDLAIVSETSALAYFHVNGYSIFSQEMPAIHMQLIGDKWLFDAFGVVFDAECVYRPSFRFSECPLSEGCSHQCGIYPSKIALPICTEDFECECKCADIDDLKGICAVNYVSKIKTELKHSTCIELSNFLKGIDVTFEDDDTTVTIKNLGKKELINVYILINKDYAVPIGNIKPEKSKVINKEDIKNKETGLPFTNKRLNSIYIYSDQGRYYYNLDKYSFTYL